MLELQDVVKRYGQTVAVDGLSLTARPGAVTGFLGPNGAGKSTALRVLLGLDRPDEGRALVCGRPYVERRAPLHEVGALLDAKAVAPAGERGRTCWHWRAATASPYAACSTCWSSAGSRTSPTGPSGRSAWAWVNGSASRRRCSATRRCSCSTSRSTVSTPRASSGSGRCCARWREGRTVLLSSHLMSEMALTAEDLVVVGRGRLIAQTTVDEVLARAGGGRVTVRTPDPDRFAALLRTSGLEATADSADPTRLHLAGTTTDDVGRLAADHAVTVLELSAEQGSLEQAYLELTAGAAQYRGTDATQVAA